MQQHTLIGLYGAGLFAAYLAGARNARLQPKTPNRGWTATHVLLAAIAIPSALQFVFPALLGWFERDAERFVHGEWWRLFTPLFFQDAGVSGAAFNLIGLFLIGRVAEKVWNRSHVLLLFFAGGIGAEAVGMLWQPIGAGNSVGSFSLAASVAVACLVQPSTRIVQALAAVALAADLALLALRDIHGAAAMIGCVLAGVLLFRSRTSSAHT